MKKKEKIKTRNQLAVVAKFRNSAGPIPDKKKKESKEKCKKEINEDF